MKDNKILYKGFHSIEQILINLKGKERTFERLKMNSAVAAIVTDIHGKIGIVKQLRPCVSEITYEIPAGMIDKPNKSDKEILIEELEEECAINRSDIIYFSENPLHKYYMLCGSSDAEISIYRVKLKSKEKNKIVHDMDVSSVEWITFNELEQLVQTGQLTDAKTLIAYFCLKNEYFK